MKNLQEVIDELSEKHDKAKYYDRLLDKRDFVEWVEKLYTALREIDENLHDDCMDQDSYNDLEKKCDGHFDELIKIQRELNAFAARIV